MSNIKKIAQRAIDYAVGVVLMSPAMIVLLSSAIGVSTSVASALILLVLAVLVALFLVSKPKLRLGWGAVIVCALLSVLFIVSRVVFSDINYNVFQFGFYVLLPILIMQQDFEFERVLRVVVILSVPLVFFIGKMLVVENVGLNQADMYATYSFVPSIIASCTHFVFFRDKDKDIARNVKKNFLVIIGYLLNLYYCVRVAQTAVRGYWLVLIVYALLLVVLLMQKKLKKKAYCVALGGITLTLVLVAVNIGGIVEFLTQGVVDMNEGGEVGFLLKMKRLLMSGDLLNGREEIWRESVGHILQNPIFGNGIESMERLSGGAYPYPHNFVLQLLQDCGVLALGLIFAVGYLIYDLLRYGYEKKDKTITLVLVSITVPMLMLSGDIWKNAVFWMMVGYGIKKIEMNIYGKNKS